MTGDRYRSPRWGRTSARNNRSTFPPAPLGYESKTRNDSILTKLTAWAFPAAAGLKNFRGRHFQGKVFLVVTGNIFTLPGDSRFLGCVSTNIRFPAQSAGEFFRGYTFQEFLEDCARNPFFFDKPIFLESWGCPEKIARGKFHGGVFS